MDMIFFFLFFIFFKIIYLFIYLLAVLGLRFCARAFSSCGKRGPLFIAVRGPLTITASLVAEHRLQTRRLSSCGSRAQLLRGMWDLPRPGLEPMSPALAGRFSTTAPPGKPLDMIFDNSVRSQKYLLEMWKINLVGIVGILYKWRIQILVYDINLRNMKRVCVCVIYWFEEITQKFPSEIF